MQIITRETLANILDVKPSTLRVWMDGYRFTKFGVYTVQKRRKTLSYIWSDEFIETLLDFLAVIKNYKALSNLNKFIKNKALNNEGFFVT